MKNVFILLVVCVCGLMLTACGDAKGTPVEYGKACAIENEKKVIEVSGYLAAGVTVMCSNIGGGPVRCAFRLFETPGAEKSFGADIPEGTWANNAEKPGRGFKKEDLKIRDKDGNLINLAEKVKLTGTMNTVADGSVCFLNVTKIEKQ